MKLSVFLFLCTILIGCSSTANDVMGNKDVGIDAKIEKQSADIPEAIQKVLNTKYSVYKIEEAEYVEKVGHPNLLHGWPDLTFQFN